MAETKAIKDELVLKLARLHCTAQEQWQAKHHMMLIWDYFRQAGYAPKDIAQAGKDWDSFYSNSHSGYASNQAKHMAASGICAPSKAESAKAEFK